MKKRMLSALLALTMVGTMALAGCGAKEEAPAENSQAEESADLLAEIKERGYITVAMEGTWAPWTYHDESDALVGFDVEVAKYIADYIGVDVKYEEGEWDGLLAGLETGRYDMMVNGVDWTEERAQKYDFSEPYCYIRTALITKKGNEEIKTFEDLKGKKTCNSTNSTYMLLAEEYGAEVDGVETLDGTLEMVLAGRADATLNAEVSFYDYMGVHPDAELQVVALTEEANNVCIPMVKGEGTATLAAAVNEAIAAAREDGTLAELSMKYFGVDISE